MIKILEIFESCKKKNYICISSKGAIYFDTNLDTVDSEYDFLLGTRQMPSGLEMWIRDKDDDEDDDATDVNVPGKTDREGMFVKRFPSLLSYTDKGAGLI